MGGIRGSYRKLGDVGSGKERWNVEMKLEKGGFNKE